MKRWLTLALCSVGCAGSPQQRPARVVDEQAENDRVNEAARQAKIQRNAEERAAKKLAAESAASETSEADAPSVAWSKIDVDACALRAEDASCLAIEQFMREYPKSSKLPDAKRAADAGSELRGAAMQKERDERNAKYDVKRKAIQKKQKEEEDAAMKVLEAERAAKAKKP